MLNLMRSNLISRCRESVRRMERLILEQSSRDILEAWTLLMWELAEDLEQAEEAVEDCKARIRSMERVHKQDRDFFEDVQTQMEDEHKQELEQERERGRRAVSGLERRLAELGRELALRETELATAMEVKAELLQRIQGVFRRDHARRRDSGPQQDATGEELNKLKERVIYLEKELKETKQMLAEESDKCFHEGIRVGRKMAAIEEIAVLEELEMLKDIERALQKPLERSDSEITLQSMVIIEAE